MARLSNSIKDWLSLYINFDSKKVGIGIEPEKFATKGYAKKKTGILLIGGLNEFTYSGAEHDLKPKALIVAFEPVYNTVIGINLNYMPQQYRHAVIKYVFMSNKLRIRQQKPLIIDFKNLMKTIPQITGAIRRYKIVGIKVLNTYPLNEWMTETQGKTTWQAMYRSPKLAKKQMTTRKDIFTKTP